MYARVTTIQGAPAKMDDAKGHTQEQTLPQLQKMDGFKGFVALGDRNSGKLLGVAFWESEEALRATTAKFTGGWKIQPAEVLTSGQGFGVWATMPCGRTCQGRRWGMVRTLIIVVVFLLMQLF